MSGKNPYIKTTEATRPSHKFTIEFQPMGVRVEVDPASMPASGTGEQGSLLDIALASGVDIDHACGGVCACSTCHVIVRQGLETCNDSSEAEDDQLEKAPGLTAQSRLACQAVPNGTRDLVVEVPSWNRNRVRE